MIKLPRLCAFLSALLLAGCAPETDYVDSPTVKAEFFKVLPDIDKNKVDVVSICHNARTDTWRTSVKFDDDRIYTYSLNVPAKTVEYEDSSTKSQRNLVRSSYSSSDVDMGCIGRYTSDGFATLMPDGTYRLHVGTFFTNAYVYRPMIVNSTFGEDDKMRIHVAAIAVRNAIELHNKDVPNESSWGL